MIRRVIEIDRDKCNGCGLCVTACHEGAIGMVGGKAALLRDDYCDGLGNCLPACPVNAITFVEREAAAFDEEAVRAAQAPQAQQSQPLPCGCPGTNAKSIERRPEPVRTDEAPAAVSQLNQWPVQIKLVPVRAPYFENAHLLIAADCAAYAHGDFHRSFMKNKITIIGCPKLDQTEYSEKLTEILRSNHIRSLTVVRMEVPCCGGIESAAVTALQNSGKMIPWQVVTLGTDGEVIE